MTRFDFADEASTLACAAIHLGPLGQALPMVIKRIVEMTDSGRQAPNTRARAVRALAAIARSDTMLLSHSHVRAAMTRALQVRTELRECRPYYAAADLPAVNISFLKAAFPEHRDSSQLAKANAV